MTERTLILDFDGTICMGSGPMLAYAHGVAKLDPSLEDLEERVTRFLDGEAVPGLSGARDGYMAVAMAAAAAGLEQEATQPAFLDARTRLAQTGLGTRAPHGLAELLDELRSAGVRVVLVTNAPPAGLDRTLVRLGLDGRFDAVVADANKPDGLADVLDGLGHPVSADTVLSVGDIFVNDLALPAARGASTALIDPFGTAEGDPTHRARRFEDLFEAVRTWGGIDRREGARLGRDDQVTTT